jgi:hypothetical protein
VLRHLVQSQTAEGKLLAVFARDLPASDPVLLTYFFSFPVQSFWGVVRTVPAYADVALMIVLLIMIMGMCGALMFLNTAEGAESFSSLRVSFVSLLILLTTANFPDVMMPAYNVSRAYIIFFASFVVVGIYFLLNFVLAIIYR